MRKLTSHHSLVVALSLALFATPAFAWEDCGQIEHDCYLQCSSQRDGNYGQTTRIGRCVDLCAAKRKACARRNEAWRSGRRDRRDE